ncbi:polyhomeotic-like protein 3 isoform X1 [Syngnathus acus]|uniref:polyhomeotic-like protein 3 isoform X1 n=1 Tax=Syngnathus acus TaxID=161584 RepID=UPI00188605F0|nr:polyhomeotic-like protein 3 isoform X1 [Syngnathus acus]
MDKEAGGASQSDRGPASSSSSDSAAAGTPTPPRLTPNPMLLQDLPAPPQTPVTSSPPPPLTPAPSLSTPKMAAAARTSSPHVLVPAPPKLTTTASSALRTYARPILPCASKTTAHVSSSSVGGTTSSPSLSTTASSAKTSMVLTNGSTRSVPAPTSNTITPFHTPASPPGRQVPQPHPAGSPGSARHRTSQQALLLGKGLKGSGQEQVLLRTQMVSNAGTPSGAVGRRLTVASSCLVSVCGAQLQSVTQRPPLPAALAAPPSLRLKPPASAPPPLSRPQTALFPPLRPRPPTAPCRHLSVPPPTLYSPVRAVPLRPKLQCVRALSPWVSAALQTQPPPTEIGVLPVTVPPLAASSSETPPSASRRLQIIALSSARPPQSVARPTLSRREALPLSQSVASPPRRKDSEAPPAGLHDVHVTEKDQRREDEDEPVKMEAKKEADLLERQQMEVTEEDHGDREQPMELQEEGAAAEVPSPVARPQALKEPPTESNITETDLPEALPVRPPEACVRAIEAPELPADGTGQEELCERVTDDRGDIINESVSAHSDNHSALSSLSSQSPPSSPWTDPASHAAAQPLNLSRSQPAVENRRASETATEAEPPPDPSEDGPEDRATDRPWQTGPWPQGRDVLTHVVEGFVIQEGLQPFPVNRSSLLLLPQAAPSPPAQEVNGSKTAVTATEEATEHSEHSTDSQDEDGKDAQQHGTRASHCERTVLHCQFCGKRGHAHNFMRSKRFCSTSCARGFNVRLTKRLRALSAGSRGDRPTRPVLNRAQSVPGKPLLLRLPRDLWSAGRREKDAKEDKKVVVATEEEHRQEDEEEEEEDMEAAGEEEEQEDEGEEEPAAAVSTRMESPASERVRMSPAATPTTPTSTFKPEPSQWTVEDVTAFIHTLPGCGEVSSAFRLQEIDGQALLLLTEEHLMGSMNIKLGPALKICAHINALKNL